MNHFVVHLKVTPHCKSTPIKFFKKETLHTLCWEKSDTVRVKFEGHVMFWLSQTKGNPLLSAPECPTPFAASPFVMSHQKVYCESHWKCPAVYWMKKARWTARRMSKPSTWQTLGGLHVTPLPRQLWGDNYLRTQLPVWEYLSLETELAASTALIPFTWQNAYNFEG